MVTLSAPIGDRGVSSRVLHLSPSLTPPPFHQWVFAVDAAALYYRMSKPQDTRSTRDRDRVQGWELTSDTQIIRQRPWRPPISALPRDLIVSSEDLIVVIVSLERSPSRTSLGVLGSGTPACLECHLSVSRAPRMGHVFSNIKFMESLETSVFQNI